MEYRRLGASGMYVSEIAYGNWLTHGSQVEFDTAKACVSAALDVGITTFDTADVYADTRAESALGEALSGVRREGLEICTKVFFPTGPGRNDRGLSRISNPRWCRFARSSASARSSGRRWRRECSPASTRPEQRRPPGRGQPMTCGKDMVERWLGDDVLNRVQQLGRLAADAGLEPGTLALAWVLRNPNVAAAIVGASRPAQVEANARAAGVRLDDDLVTAIDAVLGDVVERDPGKVESFRTRP